VLPNQTAFAELPPGTFQLDVTSQVSLSLTTTVTIVDGQLTTRDVSLLP